MEQISDINFIETGDSLLVSSNTKLAKIIQFAEKVKWNHAAMFFWLEGLTYIKGHKFDKGLHVAEMVRKGFVLTPFSKYITSDSGLLVCKPKFAVDKNKYWNYITPQLYNEGYGFFNLLIAQPIKFLTNYRIWLGDVNDDNPKRFICGEKVERIYHEFNPDLFPNWKRDAPSDIFKDTHFIKNVIKNAIP